MWHIIRRLSAVTLATCSAMAAAQQPASPPSTSVTQSCTDLKPKARQECLKVARQMDSDTPAPETASSSSAVDTVHHSSSVMETPEERAAAAKAAKAAKPSASKPPRPKVIDEKSSPAQ